jgi:hypothetical protein
MKKRHITIVVVAASAGLGISLGLVLTGGSSPRRFGGTVAIVDSSPASQASSPAKLTVFSTSGSAPDRLPNTLVADARNLAQALGGPLLGKSRLLFGKLGGQFALYGWPTANGALCLAIGHLADGCRVDLGNPVVMSAQAVTDGRTVVAGIVDDSVKSVFVSGNGTKGCSVTVQRNGFLCVLAGKLNGTAVIQAKA